MQKSYNLQYLKKEKAVLVDFSSEEVTKSLLTDVYSLAGEIQARELYISVSLMNPNKSSTLKNLLVFGFEKASGEEFTSNEEVMVLKMEVNQEYDFVDLI